ncbi:nicotinamide riboside transporter PnuC [Williamsia sp. CHRR-6]|uniref:nicotinamide riboside transporter PnuC n=1 Tax=Williamsia sp. CHRR-6 TaxID=2835871 RepID=UPI001BDA5B18|nr:nicotinamide riboside transporter PnuC [Williamsia sp. CHRR-6]MBT0566481.1 nicotinamide riboside transporter PnuC [Williamsia sp. CHRR-6]
MNVLDWLQAPAFTSFGAPTSRIELIGFITGALCVYLVARQNVWNWPIGIANNIAFVALFLTAGLYADSGLQIVYVALGVWGWYRWTARREAAPHSVTGTSPTEWFWLIAAGVSATAVLTYLLTVGTESTVPFFDAVTTALSLVATWGQARKRWESWVLWIIADVIYVPLYLYKGLTLTALLYLGFIVLCVIGLREWRRDMAAGVAAATPSVATV